MPKKISNILEKIHSQKSLVHTARVDWALNSTNLTNLSFDRADVAVTREALCSSSIVRVSL